MSLATFLADLSFARDRFALDLRTKGLSLPADATIMQCIAALESYWSLGSVVPSAPYTYPADVATDHITIFFPEARYFAGNPQGFDIETYVWSDDDVLTVEVLSEGVPVSTEILSQAFYMYGDYLTGEVYSFGFQSAGDRLRVGIESGVTGELTVNWKRQGTVVKTETVNFTGYHIPQYFTRPEGLGAWQLKINGTVVAAEYWDGSAWQDFPAGGLTAAYAGFYVRAKSEPEVRAESPNCIACWSNNGADGDPFAYLT